MSSFGALRLALAAATLMLASVAGASACAICFNGLVVTVGQQIDAADQVVLADPLPEEKFRVVAGVKGDLTVGAIIAEAVSNTKGRLAIDAFAAEPASSVAQSREGGPLLLIRNQLGQQWVSAGPIDLAHAGWLRQVAATYHGKPARARSAWPRSTLSLSELTDAEWGERLTLVAPYLENSEPIVADIAYGEISRAPYGVLRALRPKLSAAKIAGWVDDSKLETRHSSYLLLLGIAGDSSDAAVLERRIDAAWTSHSVTELAAMLAADLEIRGPSRVGAIETMYFADGKRTLPEIEAALLALSVQGGANAAIPRARVIEAYRVFMRERKPMAGFVALELADWKYWDATSDYVDLLRSNTVKDPASHFMIVNYLAQSPQAAAKAALRSLERKPR